MCAVALNNACLVYDGRLVIDDCFHTNDVSIRAAGPLTKYQRRYYTQLTHADFNSKEIGVQVRDRLNDAIICEKHVEFVCMVIFDEGISVINHLDFIVGVHLV